MHETLGEKIKYYRKERGYTQDKLANLSGISKMSIRRYERNERYPTFDAMQKIASALKVSPIKLLGDEYLNLKRIAEEEALCNYLYRKFDLYIESIDGHKY
ncbi:MAG: helix-turn-helix domain-containing protein, partial [Ruminococcus sp.]